MKLLIEGGRVLDPGRRFDRVCDVYIEEGKVVEIGNGLKKRHGRGQTPKEGSDPSFKVIAAKGRWVIPGIIDIHVHLREPGREKDETIRTGTRAAAMGGVTTVLCMPNTDPVIDTAERVTWVRKRADKDAAVRVLVAGAVSKGQNGAELAPLGGMADAGAAAFSDDGKPVATAQLMRRALEYARPLGLPVIDHCEELTLSEGGCMHEGETSFRLGLAGIPRASETVTALRDIELARLTGGRLHLAHISCAETVAAVRRAKKAGVAVTAEACPHHFALTDRDIPAYDSNFKMNPPLRAKADVEALLEGLADGTIDAIATDHAPHSPDKKAKPFSDAPFGVIGLETLVPLSLHLVRKKTISPLRWAALLSAGPAAVLGLKDRGALKPGADADITVVDPEAEKVYERSESRSRNSPFFGRKLKGAAAATVVGGEVVMEEGRIV